MNTQEPKKDWSNTNFLKTLKYCITILNKGLKQKFNIIEMLSLKTEPASTWKVSQNTVN